MMEIENMVFITDFNESNLIKNKNLYRTYFYQKQNPLSQKNESGDSLFYIIQVYAPRKLILGHN